MHTWDIRLPGGASGIEFARARIDPATRVIVHALPHSVSVTITDEDSVIVAEGDSLKADGSTPMSRLSVEDGRVARENIWPTEADIGTTVILAGGEAGVLTAWWNAPDHSEWRWSIELYNHR